MCIRDRIKNQYADLMERSKLKLNVVGIASSKNAIFNRDGICLLYTSKRAEEIIEKKTVNS